jgi:hypothetical protein
MTLPAAALPTIGEANSTADAKLLAAISELRTIISALDSSNLAADSVGNSEIIPATITLAELASATILNFAQRGSGGATNLKIHGPYSVVFNLGAGVSDPHDITHNLGTTNIVAVGGIKSTLTDHITWAWESTTNVTTIRIRNLSAGVLSGTWMGFMVQYA